jgi:acyl-CoA reductase-like NAD-dependent aldehyde dehydrogenase
VDVDLLSVQQARDLATRARTAGLAWSEASQVEVDRVVDAVARAGRAAAPRLAELAVRVTRMGRADHKLIKDLFNTTQVHDAIAPLATAGVIATQPGLVEVAEPMGVIAALVPTTNPVSTVFFKALIALKARNTIVLAPHPRAAEASLAAAEVIRGALRTVGVPEDLVCCMSDVSVEGSTELMRHPDVSLVLATGSAAMVRAAYSVGKPTYAVGPGNVPVYVHDSADASEVAAGTVASAAFDYGTPCASEQAAVVDRSLEPRLRQAMEANGARFLTADEADRLARAVFTPQLTFVPDCVGQSPQWLGERAGIPVDPAATVLVVSPGGVGITHPLSMEILTSTLKWFSVSGLEEAMDRTAELLRFGGEGHTAGVWTADDNVAGTFAARARAFRVLVNTPAAFGAMGATTALAPSFMLGTGTWAGSITADNIGPLHLVNRKRIARGIRGWRELGTAAQTGAGVVSRNGHRGPTAAPDPGAVTQDLVRRVLDRLHQQTMGVSR